MATQSKIETVQDALIRHVNFETDILELSENLTDSELLHLAATLYQTKMQEFFLDKISGRLLDLTGTIERKMEEIIQTVV